MGRRNIYFSEPVEQALDAHIEEKYSGKRALSLVVEEAVKEYLKIHLDRLLYTFTTESPESY